MDLDVAGHRARVLLRATWINPHPTPTQELVFNAHSRYVVPDADIGLTAKTLEMLRMYPGDTLGVKEPCLEIHHVCLADAGLGQNAELKFRYEGDTKTSLVVPLPRPVRGGESVSVLIDLTLKLPPKQGRWGQWEDVTYLSNWLPVFAFYGSLTTDEASTPAPPPTVRGQAPDNTGAASSEPGSMLAPPPRPLNLPEAPAPPPPAKWQPTAFVPWHQPFFNEAGIYRAVVTLPGDQKVACTGTIVERQMLPDGRQRLTIQADGVRDFAFLCSARYQSFEGEADPGGGRPRIRVHILAFPEHEHYARAVVKYAVEALTTYSHWFGPYPYPDFTIAEAFFGWNGNECATLVMIDSRIFGMPHLADGFVEQLILHETCHQWWYNLIGTNGYAETWMDEGLASYFSHLLMDQRHGHNSPMMHYPRGLEWLPNIHREDYHSYGLYGAIARGDNGPVVRDLPKFGHVMNLFSMTYDKGLRIVGMIANRLGQPAFDRFMHGIYNRYRYRILRVADFRRELEAYTGQSWLDFFRHWLYGSGLTDWSMESVQVQKAPKTIRYQPSPLARRQADGWDAEGRRVKVTVVVKQRGEYSEPTVVGFGLPHQDGYPVRIPVLPGSGPYQVETPPTEVEPLNDKEIRIVTFLPARPTQVAVDPDQILIDRDPANNFWKPRIRWRITPLCTFLDETDLTNAYDRWNVMVGPWVYGTAYNEAWYTRSTMIGVRASAYRTQSFFGGVYSAYRTDFRDVVMGADALWDHWPDPHMQVGFNVERRLASFYDANETALRAAVWARYVLTMGSSLYLPPFEYVDAFTSYQDNFLPYLQQLTPGGQRYTNTTTAGLHYRKNWLTPYWDAQGGYQFDVWYEGGMANLQNSLVGLNKLSSQLSFVKGLPDFSGEVAEVPGLSLAAPLLRWLGKSRMAFRVYGATSAPGRGEFFTMGGGTLFRGYDLAQRQGSSVWVGSVEWRVPLATNLHVDACDHTMGLRNVFGAFFYDVGNAYAAGHSAGPTAHALGIGLRLDVTWFSFVERTIIRLDLAKTINDSTPTELWFGVTQPF